MHIVYGILYIQDMSVANWRMNEIILEFFIFKYKESNYIGVWSYNVHLECYIEKIIIEIYVSMNKEPRSEIFPTIILLWKNDRVEKKYLEIEVSVKNL